MAQADGSIIIKAEINDKQAQKRLNTLSKKIDETEQKAKDVQSKRDEEQEKSVFQAAELDNEKAKLQEIKDRLQDIKALAKDKTAPLSDQQLAQESIPGVQQELAEQRERVRMLQSEYNKTAASVERYDSQLERANSDLNRMQTEAGQLVQQLSSGSPVIDAMNQQFERVNKSVDKFKKRVNTLFKRVLIFSMFTRVFRAFSDEMGLALNSSKEFTTAMSQLKGNLRVAFQPLWQLIIPALTQLVRLASAAAAALARLFAFLSGKSLGSLKDSAQAMTDEANAIGGAGGAAEDAGKQLAAFDEINKLEDNSGGGSGGGAAEALDTSGLDVYDEKLQNILELVLAIAAGLLTWKIAKHFGADMKTAIGLAMAVGGAVYYIKAFFDAWNNGVDGDNIIKMLLGMTVAAMGLMAAFGPTAGAIALVVGAVGLLAVGIKDLIANGVTPENVMAICSGILLIGAVISLITGGPIPLLIGLIAALVTGFVLMGDEGGAAVEGLRNIVHGFVDFFTGIVTGDLSLVFQGIDELFLGLQTLAFSIIDTFKNRILGFLDWVDEKTHGKISGLIAWLKEIFSNGFETLKQIVSGAISGIKQVLSGIIEFITGVFTGDWDTAWNGLLSVVKGVVNLIIAAVEGLMNIAVDALNGLISAAGKLVNKIPGVNVEVFQIPRLELPRLATGAVIPPNREFMAVLGDQKSGTNIETPLATMIQAFKQAMAETGGGQVIENVMILDGEVIYRNQKRITKNHGVSLVGG